MYKLEKVERHYNEICGVEYWELIYSSKPDGVYTEKKVKLNSAGVIRIELTEYELIEMNK
jgi:hypothetical protein